MKPFEAPALPTWHVSSYTGAQGNCVEVAEGPDVLVRDTKNREHGHLTFESHEWASLLNTLQR
ncbi:MAG TPA: DUF397 domain-containing protein [Nocardiopsis listeri]|uniref:DUF397 domain-containing protein n=1 Tax=Nocardiopsis listeri TaxID=53440 RepID=UPI001D95F98F|nr:DUF397 domain-containing protein [Nocardiopsis listeri]HJE59947.1 DUF397 domain-containing protein [Nocardiopsis listeri]